MNRFDEDIPCEVMSTDVNQFMSDDRDEEVRVGAIDKGIGQYNNRPAMAVCKRGYGHGRMPQLGRHDPNLSFKFSDG
jgi:hypothetical protein